MTVIKINAVTAFPDSGNDVAERFPSRAETLVGQEGFEGYELLKPADGRSVWLIVMRWRDDAAFEAWARSEPGTRNRTAPPDGHLGVSNEIWQFDIASAGGS